jgi:hypothetical protein
MGGISGAPSFAVSSQKVGCFLLSFRSEAEESASVFAIALLFAIP